MNQVQKYGSLCVNDELDGVPGVLAPCTGRIVGSEPSGAILVDFGSGPRVARLMASAAHVDLSSSEMRGREVLVVFDNGDHRRPIIIGLLADPLDELFEVHMPEEHTGMLRTVAIDGRRLTIEAQDEIVLKCGKGSITLRKNGKIIIKGTHLLSRSSGPVRVKGARVNIN